MSVAVSFLWVKKLSFREAYGLARTSAASGGQRCSSELCLPGSRASWMQTTAVHYKLSAEGNRIEISVAPRTREEPGIRVGA